jgi:hypothetical protein
MRFHKFLGRQSRLVTLAVFIAVLQVAPLHGQGPRTSVAQEPSDQPREIRAVIRIEKQLIDDAVSRKQVVAAIPFNAKVVDFRFQGVIDGQGKLSMEMSTEDGQATFTIYGRGDGQTYTRGVHCPLAVRAGACGPFVSRTLVRYDGRKFSRVETIPSAEAHVDLDRVEGIHGRLPGRVVGRLARPIAERLIPRAEAQASAVADYLLKDFVDGLADEIVERINRDAPVQKSLNRLFPDTPDWVFQMSSDPRYLQAAFGPAGSPVPALPPNPTIIKDVRLELWLRSTTKEAQALADLSKKPLARLLVREYIESVLPELAALTDEITVDGVGSWLVITIGPPKAE